jgi:hypothetical protein
MDLSSPLDAVILSETERHCICCARVRIPCPLRSRLPSPCHVLLCLVGCRFGEHCGRYEHVAKLLNDEGFVVLSMDHQGHGQSEGDRAHVRMFSDYVDDVIQYVEQEAKEYEGSGIPLFLLVAFPVCLRACVRSGSILGGTIACWRT